MLVIISDLHLTDGTSGETIREGAFRVLRQRLSDSAYDASWRDDHEYRPIEQLDLVLLGDILDVIRSTKWLESSIRPWDDFYSSSYKSRVKEISDDILKHNTGSLAILKSLTREGGVHIPPAVNKKPDHETRDRCGVAVKIHYLVGNHDWFYHLPGTDYDDIRRSVVETLGLANVPTEPFLHDPQEPTKQGEVIRQLFEEHRVFARHGDIFDSFNYDQEHGRDASSLGDAIVVELLNRFPRNVANDLGDRLPKETIEGLKEIDNVRPLPLIPAWIEGLLRRTVPDKSLAREVKGVWDTLVDEFLDIPFVRQRDRPFHVDLVDSMEAALKISKGLSMGFLSKIAASMSKRGKEESLSGHAVRERDFKSRRADYVVYGHTHHAEVVPLDTVHLGSRVSRQIYFNSGTWRRVHELASFDPQELEFLDWNVMTYLCFFQADERRGRPFEAWSGSLGV